MTTLMHDNIGTAGCRLDPAALKRNRRELCGSYRNKKSGKEMAKGKAMIESSGLGWPSR